MEKESFGQSMPNLLVCSVDVDGVYICFIKSKKN